VQPGDRRRGRHLVKEIDALGGEMASVIDATGIQFRRLNASKGPAVRSTRAQATSGAIATRCRGRLEQQERLALRQGEVAQLGVIDEAAPAAVGLGAKAPRASASSA